MGERGGEEQEMKLAFITFFATAIILLLPVVWFATTTTATPTTGCIQYDAGSRTIVITCDTTWTDIVDSSAITQAPNGGNNVITSEGNGSYVLDGGLFVENNASLALSSEEQQLKWLKIVGEHAIDIEEGVLMVDGIKISSWNTTSHTEVEENANATIPRAWILIDDSTGGHIKNSELSHLGYESEENGRGGVQLDDVNDFEISNSTFHDNYFAFYSNDVSNITIDGNEYYDNLLYALDPHTGSQDMQITNNKVYDNAGFGIICSLDCTDVTIDGNTVYRNHRAGIMLSRNTTESQVINNNVYDQPSAYGVFVSQSSDNLVHNNTLKNNMYGVYVKEPTATGNEISNNNITQSKRAIVFSNVTENENPNIVANNTISKNLSYQYFMTKNSQMLLDGETFKLGEIRGAEGNNTVTIQNSGIINIDGKPVDTNLKPFVVSLTNRTLDVNP